jgi:deoxycytidylate deaminase
MRILGNEESIQASDFFNEAALVARQSRCQRSKCGAIIVDYSTYHSGLIIAKGFNSPALELESQRRCNWDKESLDRKVTDKTCCVHAEQRAIIDALKKGFNNFAQSRMFFSRLYENGQIKKSGEPYCTICSKLALDVGISEWVLWKPEGICVYDAEEYNQLSYAFKSQ